MLIEDIIIFLEAVCAGPGRENACRDRAGAHKVLRKFVRFAFDPVWTKPLRFFFNLAWFVGPESAYRGYNNLFRGRVCWSRP